MLLLILTFLLYPQVQRALPSSPLHSSLLSNNVTPTPHLPLVLQGCPCGLLGLDQFKAFTVTGLTYHYALNLWMSHMIIN